LIVEHNLDVVSRKHDVHNSNFTHCSRVLHSMNKLLHKISVQNVQQQNASLMSTTVTNNPIMISSTTSATPVSPSVAPSGINKDVINHESVSSHRAANTHMDADVVLKLPVASVAAPVDDEPHQHQPSSLLAEGDTKSTTAPEAELQLREIREEQFIREHLGDVFVEIEPYNHIHCNDCTCVYSMANECLMHLAASQHQSQEAASRMHKLMFEFKERIREDAERLEALDWGGHNVNQV
jgi:hypothetical protein